MDGIVFISLFLGLISGRQWVEMRVTDPQVKAIRLTFDGRELAMLTKPPWQTAADFGKAVRPGELVATGYDERGGEVTRASQLLNVPHPVAELQIIPQGDHERPTGARLLWHHREVSPPKDARVWFDAMPLRVAKDFSVRLPAFDALHSHVVAAEMRFKDGSVARADFVIFGGFSDRSGAQLTSIAVTRTSPGDGGALKDCFTLNGERVHVTADATTDAQLFVVRDPDPAEARNALDPRGVMAWRGSAAEMMKREPPLDADTAAQIVWPVATQIVREGQPRTKLYLRTDAPKGGMRVILTFATGRIESQPPEFADAVAVAGLRAMGSGRRRAVVLLLSSRPDSSNQRPAVVRRYLEAIGVPLFVWSLSGPRPDLADSWGAVDEISTSEKLREATDRLRATLATQRVVWVSLDPLNALRVEADPRCGLTPLARLGAP